MLRLERYRGHFFNWYDTRTLAPLEPRFVSTVDSGNLRVRWSSPRAGLEELRRRPLVPPRFFEGLQDTIEVIALLCAVQPSLARERPLDAVLAALRTGCTERSTAVRETLADCWPRSAAGGRIACAVPQDRPILG